MTISTKTFNLRPTTIIQSIKLFILIVSPLISFGQTIPFRLEGKLDKPFQGMLYLFYNSTIDSVLVDGTEYTFAGTIPGPTEASLRTKNGFYSGHLYLDKGITSVSSTIDTFGDGPLVTSVEQVSGNETHDVVLPKMQQVLDQTSIKKLIDEGNTEEVIRVTRELLAEYPSHPLSGEILSVFASMDFMQLHEIESLLSILDKEKLPPATLDEISQAMEKKRTYQIGSQLFDFGFTDENNKRYTINDFKGKYLLIEFWDSRCVPCREEHPSLIATRKMYEDNFEILGVSLDGSENYWQKAVSEDQLTWVNTRVKNDTDRAIVNRLGINAIPSNFLLDPTGRILAVNIGADGVRARLAKILHSGEVD